jgi:hypothetical protein
MSTAFSSLGTDNVGSNRQALGHVLGMADHVHVQDAMFVKTFDNRFRRNSDGADEQFRARINNSIVRNQ